MSLLSLLQVPRLVSVLLVLLDPESITACSLTCRQFYNACRPRILHRVTLRTERSLLDLAILLDTTPNVGQFITQLCINLFHDGRHRSSTIGNWITVIPLILNPYRHLFTRLSTFSLIGLWDEGEKSATNRIDTVFASNLSFTFSTIRVLELERCMVTLPILFLLISAFPNIESLYIIEPKRTRNINHLVAPILPSMRNLKHFALHMDDIPPRSLESNKLLDWLGSTLKASTPLDNVSTGGTTLESIDFVVRTFDVRGVVKFMSVVGPTLTVLKLHLTNPDFKNLPLLTACHSLETLTLRVTPIKKDLLTSTQSIGLLLSQLPLFDPSHPASPERSSHPPCLHSLTLYIPYTSHPNSSSILLLVDSILDENNEDPGRICAPVIEQVSRLRSSLKKLWVCVIYDRWLHENNEGLVRFRVGLEAIFREVLNSSPARKNDHQVVDVITTVVVIETSCISLQSFCSPCMMQEFSLDYCGISAVLSFSSYVLFKGRIMKAGHGSKKEVACSC